MTVRDEQLQTLGRTQLDAILAEFKKQLPDVDPAETLRSD